MLISTEHEIFMLINLKLLTMPNFFLLNIAKHEKSFITSGPDAVEFQVSLFASHQAVFKCLYRHGNGQVLMLRPASMVIS